MSVSIRLSIKIICEMLFVCARGSNATEVTNLCSNYSQQTTGNARVARGKYTVSCGLERINRFRFVHIHSGRASPLPRLHPARLQMSDGVLTRQIIQPERLAAVGLLVLAVLSV